MNIDATQLLADEIAGKYPDARGRYGPFGGRYVPETLFAAFEKLEAGMRQHLHSAEFQQELTRELSSWVGRPTALTHAPKLSKAWGAEVWLKREDLAHTGAHKINNALGQAMLAKRLGAKRVVARERLAEGVDRRGADVAEHDPDRAEHQRRHRLLGAVRGAWRRGFSAHRCPPRYGAGSSPRREKRMLSCFNLR